MAGRKVPGMTNTQAQRVGPHTRCTSAPLEAPPPPPLPPPPPSQPSSYPWCRQHQHHQQHHRSVSDPALKRPGGSGITPKDIIVGGGEKPSEWPDRKEPTRSTVTHPCSERVALFTRGERIVVHSRRQYSTGHTKHHA